jgi:hypothetical protein
LAVGGGLQRREEIVIGQLSFVIDGGASRNFLLTDAAPKAPPKMTNDN